MDKGTPTSAKAMLILLAVALLVVIAATIFLTGDRPEGNEDAGAVQPAPEQQVESEDTDMPAAPRRTPPGDTPVPGDAPVDR